MLTGGLLPTKAEAWHNITIWKKNENQFQCAITTTLFEHTKNVIFKNSLKSIRMEGKMVSIQQKRIREQIRCAISQIFEK